MIKLILNKSSVLLLLATLAILAASCSSIEKHDDALRIKPEASKKYMQNPNTKEMRDGRTLRGTVNSIVINSVPASCPLTDATTILSDTLVVFLDKNSPSEESSYEAIPIADVDLVKDFSDLPFNEHGNINIFENFNESEMLKGLREVPVNQNFRDSCDECQCNQFSADIDFDLNFNLDLSCIKRNFLPFFVELRGGYTGYNDNPNLAKKVGRESWFAEIAAGARFGDKDQWGLGLVFMSGIKAFDSFKNKDALRPVLMLHGRWQSEKDKFIGICMRPFLYGQFGLTIDDLSVSLMKFNFSSGCEDCKNKIDELSAQGLIPDIDASLPLSFGIGAGVDIPIAPLLDVSVDIGFRSIAFGESVAAAGWENIPTSRRINMLIFRLGFTI
jgi:hypothetical protein